MAAFRKKFGTTAHFNLPPQFRHRIEIQVAGSCPLRVDATL
jgi:hypothetical protein